MAEDVTREPVDAPVPRPQAFLDSFVVLFLIGLVVPTLVYIVWGLVELTSVPPFAPSP